MKGKGDANLADGPCWYGIREAAKYLEVGEQTIYRWMREGKITFRKVGDSTRFLKEDLDAVVQVFPSGKDAEREKRLCQVCHGDDLVKGDLRGAGLNYFRPTRAKFWSMREANVRTEAWMCARCGAVSMYADTVKLDKIRSKGGGESGDVSP